MRLVSLDVRNFRGLSAVSLKFQKTTVIAGRIASGKSSLLAALSFIVRGSCQGISPDGKGARTLIGRAGGEALLRGEFDVPRRRGSGPIESVRVAVFRSISPSGEPVSTLSVDVDGERYQGAAAEAQLRAFGFYGGAVAAALSGEYARSSSNLQAILERLSADDLGEDEVRALGAEAGGSPAAVESLVQGLRWRDPERTISLAELRDAHKRAFDKRAERKAQLAEFRARAGAPKVAGDPRFAKATDEDLAAQLESTRASKSLVDRGIGEIQAQVRRRGDIVEEGRRLIEELKAASSSSAEDGAQSQTTLAFDDDRLKDYRQGIIEGDRTAAQWEGIHNGNRKAHDTAREDLAAATAALDAARATSVRVCDGSIAPGEACPLAATSREAKAEEIAQLEARVQAAAAAAADAKAKESSSRMPWQQAIKATNDLRAKVQELETARAHKAGQVEGVNAAALKAKRERVEQLRAEAKDLPSVETLQVATEQAEKLSDTIRSIETEVARRAAAATSQREASAIASLEQTVEVLEDLVKMLGDKGIPALVGARRLAPLAEHASTILGEFAGYSLAFEVDPDQPRAGLQLIVRECESGNRRPLALLSESESLRLSWALQAALAERAGVGFLVVDEAAVLDELLGPFARWARKAPVQVVFAVTLSDPSLAPPASAERTVVWVEDGAVGVVDGAPVAVAS